MEQKANKYYGYNNYRGVKCWEVSHPKHRKSVIVRAANNTEAILAAAHVWKTDWRKADFHTEAKVILRPDISKTLGI